MEDSRVPLSSRFPVGFVAHGSPMIAVEPAKGAPLKAWAESVARPQAFLVISAHYEDSPLTLGTSRPQGLMYDFGGFPDELYRVKYPAPTAPWLADRIVSLLGEANVQRSDRPLDHGAWTPLMYMAPSVDVPVLELSMPRTFSPQQLFALGASLEPLRDEGVWILGSGNVVHNLRILDWDDVAGPPSWAVAFDEWIKDVLVRHDWDALLDYRRRAPEPGVAHPTDEHLRPLFVVAGAAQEDRVEFPFEGWEYGSLSRRCVQIG